MEVMMTSLFCVEVRPPCLDLAAFLLNGMYPIYQIFKCVLGLVLLHGAGALFIWCTFVSQVS